MTPASGTNLAKITRVPASLRQYGPVLTLAKIALYPFGIRAAKFDDLHDAFCDIRLGIKTDGWLERPQLDFADAQAQSHATKYHGYRYRRISRLYRACRRFLPRPEIAIDMGSGEGRLVYSFAAKGIPGLGVELSPSLIERARRNASGFRGAPVEFHHADAKDYRLPEKRAVILMFNPFDAVIMASFLENNHETIRRTGSIIAYACDWHVSVLEAHGMKRAYRDNLYQHDNFSFSIWRFD